jgi:hypothetical protein
MPATGLPRCAGRAGSIRGSATQPGAPKGTAPRGETDFKTGIALRTGNTMPLIGLGTWKLTEDTAGTVVAALAIRYRLIDTSGIMGRRPASLKASAEAASSARIFYLVTKVEETDDARFAQ